jgi:SAM-dependent methyltransferase
MVQDKNWDKEYSEKRLITGSDKPQAVFLKYLRQLKKSGVDTHKLSVLDLGSGAGRNSNYLASLGCAVTGMEISGNAISIAQKRAQEMGIKVEYIKHSIGAPYPFTDSSFDLIIDVTSSNSLSESERDVYLKEVRRVLKSDGHFFIRALLKDGDKNAKKLLDKFPGPEKDTYKLPEIGITERVFSERDFVELYGSVLKIEKVIKTSSYANVGGVSYKRNYLIGYMQKLEGSTK